MLTRQHPGYETPGVRAGSWMVYPSLLGGGFYDSNLFSSATTKKSGFATLIHPTLTATSLWERHAVNVEADVRALLYPDYPGLNQTNARFKTQARIDIGHDAALLSTFQVARLHEAVGSLSSPAGAVEPTPYNLYSGDIAYRREFNRLTAAVGGRVDSYAYGSTVAQDGTPISLASRDGQVYATYGRLDYAISPALGLFSALELNRRDLRGTATQALSSEGIKSLSGISLELTRVITAEFAAGYTRQQFDAADLGTAEGPTYRAALVWSPSRLVDISLRATQMVTQATDTDASSVRVRALQLGVDYEFRRNVVLSVSGNYETDTFLDRLREDKVYSTSTRLKYLLNRYGTISLQHTYVRRNSTLPTANFDKHQVGLNVTARF